MLCACMTEKLRDWGAQRRAPKSSQVSFPALQNSSPNPGKPECCSILFDKIMPQIFSSECKATKLPLSPGSTLLRGGSNPKCAPQGSCDWTCREFLTHRTGGQGSFFQLQKRDEVVSGWRENMCGLQIQDARALVSKPQTSELGSTLGHAEG